MIKYVGNNLRGINTMKATTMASALLVLSRGRPAAAFASGGLGRLAGDAIASRASAARRRSNPLHRRGGASSAPSTGLSQAVDAITVSDAYDGGNGELVSARIEDWGDDLSEDSDISVAVRIRPDPYTDLEGKEHFQYFSFGATLNRSSPAIKGIFSNKKSIKVKYVLDNAGLVSVWNARVCCCLNVCQYFAAVRVLTCFWWRQ